MSTALQGLVVTEWSTGLAAAMAGQILADHGADVIVVDAPGPETLADTTVAVVHRGKRRITLDVRDNSDRARLAGMIARSDFLIEDKTPETATRLGFNHDQTIQANPRLIHCSITAQGYGALGVDQTPDDALVLAALGAMTEQAGYRDGPIYIAQRMASAGAAHLAVIGSLAGLIRRLRGGAGIWVETSLADGALAQLTLFWQRFSRVPPVRVGSASLRLVAASYECADGEWLGVHSGAVGAHARLMELLGLTDRIPPVEKGLEMAAALTEEQAALLREEVPRIFRTRARADWITALLAADICAIPVLHPGEAFDLAQVHHNGMVIDLDDPRLGRIRCAGVAVKIAEAPANDPSPAPMRGVTTEMSDVRSPQSPPLSNGVGPPPHRPLEGIRVLDFSQYFAGPYASRFLADLGADVVKVEALNGDPNRANPRVFAGGHRGKRSLALNLKAAPVGDVLQRLFRDADVVVHNMRPGVAERLGIDAVSVRAVNPDAVYLYAPGWGSSGPDARRQGFAPLYSGLVGLQFEQGGRGNPPIWPIANEDYINGLHGAWSVLIGLVRRARTGMTSTIESPQLNATMTMPVGVVVRLSDGAVLGTTELDPGQHGRNALKRLYPTADGWICMATEDAEALDRLQTVLQVSLPAGRDAPDLAADGPVASALVEAFLMWPSNDLLALLRGAGVAAVRAVEASGRDRFFDDPDQQRMGRVAHEHYERWGDSDEIAGLIRLGGTPAVADIAAPALGEHTVEVLAEVGFDDATTAEFEASGAVRTAKRRAARD